MDKQIDDQDSLIESRNQENNKLQSQILIKYIVSKLFPFFWIFFSGFFISSPSLVYFFALIFTIIDLWLCRRQYSYALVGLSWNLDMPDPQLSFEEFSNRARSFRATNKRFEYLLASFDRNNSLLFTFNCLFVIEASSWCILFPFNYFFSQCIQCIFVFEMSQGFKETIRRKS